MRQSWFDRGLQSRFSLAVLLSSSLSWSQSPTEAPVSVPEALHRAVDGWLDNRFERGDPTLPLRLLGNKPPSDLHEVEAALRAGRFQYPAPPAPRGKLTRQVPLPCDHVDHETQFMIYVPTAYDPKRAHPLLLVVHGGSAARDIAFGERAARGGIDPHWIREAEQRGWILVAPITDRGWMHIGNSILFSALSQVQRDYHIDPDRVYLTGHSMGGHMSWRSAFQFPDRFAAVSPMSGGYDYVKSKDVTNLLNIPGYTTYGTNEPYQIREFNDIISDWMKEHRYPWICQRKEGGHEIFADEVPKVADFFARHSRELYRPRVYARMGAHPFAFESAETNPAWKKEHRWDPKRPLPASTVHWLRCFPPAEGTPPDKRIQTIDARYLGDNQFVLISENARRLRIYLHPRMVDFEKPIVVKVNGAVLFNGKVTPDPVGMLELAKEFDDRGRVFWAGIAFNIETDGELPPPFGP